MTAQRQKQTNHTSNRWNEERGPLTSSLERTRVRLLQTTPLREPSLITTSLLATCR
jgi:hypothetical protein